MSLVLLLASKFYDCTNFTMNTNLQNFKFQTNCWIQVANIGKKITLSQLSSSYSENFVSSLKYLFHPKPPGTVQHETLVSGRTQHPETQRSLNQIHTSLLSMEFVYLSMIPAAEGKWCHWTFPHAQSVPNSIRPKFVFYFLNQLRLVAKLEKKCCG